MLLSTYLANLKPFYILKFGSFSTYFPLTSVDEIFIHLLNVYVPKYRTAEKFWPIKQF
jgi:hypothetical protein